MCNVTDPVFNQTAGWRKKDTPLMHLLRSYLSGGGHLTAEHRVRVPQPRPREHGSLATNTRKRFDAGKTASGCGRCVLIDLIGLSERSRWRWTTASAAAATTTTGLSPPSKRPIGTFQEGIVCEKQKKGQRGKSLFVAVLPP